MKGVASRPMDDQLNVFFVFSRLGEFSRTGKTGAAPPLSQAKRVGSPTRPVEQSEGPAHLARVHLAA
jgi:hypothetical protein